jgi:hypothetical protein
VTESWTVEKQDEKIVKEERKEEKVEEERSRQVKISASYEKPSRISKKAPLLNIPLKSATPLRAPNILILRVSVIPQVFARLDIISAKAPQSSILTPTLKAFQKPCQDIRVQVYEPLKIAKLTCSSLKLKLKSRKDWSIRPLLEPLTIADLGLHNPCLAYRSKRIKGLGILPAPVVKSDKICTPRMQIAPAYFTMEEVRRVVYKLWLIGFDEDFIVECISKTYGLELSKIEIMRILDDAKEGKIEISMLPDYVNKIVHLLIAEKGGVRLRGMLPNTKLAAPSEQKIEHVKISERLQKQITEPVVEVEPLSLPEYLLDAQYLSERYHRLGGLGGISGERLVCILVDKSRGFHEFIELICARLWRIKSRGFPRTSIKNYSEELYWCGLSEDIVELDKVQQIIEDLPKKGPSEKERIKNDFINEVKSRSIEGKLRFLLLPIEGSKFGEAYKLLNESHLKIEHYLKHSEFFAFKLREISHEEEEIVRRILSAAFGFAEAYGLSIGEYALKLEGEFIKKLEEIIRMVKDKVSSIKLPKPGPEGEFPEESWLHLALKHLTYAHLLFNEGVAEEGIECEKEVEGVGKIADVLCKKMNIAIEIETMYGTGDPIGVKINPKTIMPYYEHGFKGELWLVIPNIHAFLFLHELLKLRKDYREQQLNLEIYVADVTGMGAWQIYGEKRGPGLVRLIDVLNFIKK